MRVLLLSGVWQHALQLRGRRWEGATSQARAMRNYTHSKTRTCGQHLEQANNKDVQVWKGEGEVVDVSDHCLEKGKVGLGPRFGDPVGDPVRQLASAVRARACNFICGGATSSLSSRMRITPLALMGPVPSLLAVLPFTTSSRSKKANSTIPTHTNPHLHTPQTCHEDSQPLLVSPLSAEVPTTSTALEATLSLPRSNSNVGNSSSWPHSIQVLT
jgi:hypothetical protein